MPQKKKSKTKKQMLKSINVLWNALQHEKTSHAKATKYISKLKDGMNQQGNILRHAYETERGMELTICRMKREAELQNEFTANLVKNLRN